MKNIIFYFILFIICVMLLLSCTTARKATDYMKKHPDIGSEYCKDAFPVLDSVIVRDSISFDTLYLEPLPEIIRDSFYIQGDTIIRTVTKQCPPHQTITKTVRHDSIIIRRDRAFEYVQSDTIKNQAYTIREQAADLNRVKHGRNLWRIIAIGLMLLIAAYTIGRFKKILP